MIVATFVESYYGAEFASRLIYKSLPFMLMQFFLFLSVIMALLGRLPFVARLSGFYVIHIGLILIACGSFITYHSGVDGQITLSPNNPNRSIVLPDDILAITNLTTGEKLDLTLPRSVFSSSLGKIYKGIKIDKYLPFSKMSTKWMESKKIYGDNAQLSTSSYLIFNKDFNKNVTLSLHPQSQDYSSTLELGNITLQYLPASFSECLQKESESRLIVFNSVEGTCFTPEQKQLSIGKSKLGNRTIRMEVNGITYIFFPDFSPVPISENFELLNDSPLRILSKKLFETNATVFLFGNKYAVFLDKKWQINDLKLGNTADLPWMGLKLRLLKHSNNLIPVSIPRYILPHPEEGESSNRFENAISFKTDKKTYWLTTSRPEVTIDHGGEQIQFILTKKTLKLPFELVLTKFKMDTNPGTNMPASFESFVRLFTSEGPKRHHIYMNNPLKYQGITFYQSSYFKGRDGEFGSVLSANIDPGRALKYFGSLLLVIGSLIHYYIISKRKKLTRPQNA